MQTVDDIWSKIISALELSNVWGTPTYITLSEDKCYLRAKYNKPIDYIEIQYEDIYSLDDPELLGFSATCERLYQPSMRIKISVIGINDILSLIDNGFINVIKDKLELTEKDCNENNGMDS